MDGGIEKREGQKICENAVDEPYKLSQIDIFAIEAVRLYHHIAHVCYTTKPSVLIL